ncbi:MAG: hypothetical protein ACI92Z_003781 [Paracoccaceae bacterium]
MYFGAWLGGSGRGLTNNNARHFGNGFAARLLCPPRGENVCIYRLHTAPEGIRKLIEEYMLDANALAKQPEFANSLTSNCTTTVYKMMNAVGGTTPLDWRLIVNDYLPEYAYEQGVLATNFSVTELRSLGHINARAIAAGLNETYSSAIRVGIPPQNSGIPATAPVSPAQRLTWLRGGLTYAM